MTADTATLLALAARAEAGGDATLSDDCWIALGWVRYDSDPGFPVAWEGPEEESHNGPRPALDTSIDAQAELPGRIWKVSYCPVPRRDGTTFWEARAELPNFELTPCSFAPTEALARLSALLRAMAAAAQESGDGG